MAQEILWPEIGAAQGRVHAPSKLDFFRNDNLSKIFEFTGHSVGLKRFKTYGVPAEAGMGAKRSPLPLDPSSLFIIS